MDSFNSRFFFISHQITQLSFECGDSSVMLQMKKMHAFRKNFPTFSIFCCHSSFTSVILLQSEISPFVSGMNISLNHYIRFNGNIFSCNHHISNWTKKKRSKRAKIDQIFWNNRHTFPFPNGTKQKFGIERVVRFSGLDYCNLEERKSIQTRRKFCNSKFYYNT